MSLQYWLTQGFCQIFFTKMPALLVGIKFYQALHRATSPCSSQTRSGSNPEFTNKFNIKEIPATLNLNIPTARNSGFFSRPVTFNASAEILKICGCL